MNFSLEKLDDNLNPPSHILSNLKSLNVSIYAFQEEIMSSSGKKTKKPWMSVTAGSYCWGLTVIYEDVIKKLKWNTSSGELLCFRIHVLISCF